MQKRGIADFFHFGNSDNDQSLLDAISGDWSLIFTATNAAAETVPLGFGTLPGFATDGQQQFFAYNPASNAVVVADGLHWRLSPQAYFYHGPFGMLGEYVILLCGANPTCTMMSSSYHFADSRSRSSGSSAARSPLGLKSWVVGQPRRMALSRL